MRKLLIIISIICLVSCASFNSESSDMPSWIYSPYTGYSSDTHIIAVGSAYNSEKAHYNALSELVTNFSVSVDTTTLVYDDGTSAVMKESAYVNSDISNIEGVDVLNTYYDGTLHYMRLCIDKNKVKKLYLNKVHTIEKEIATLLIDGNKAESIVEKLNCIEAVNSLIKEHNSKIQILSILTPYNKSYNLKQIKKDLLSGYTIAIDDDEIRQLLLPALEANNIRIDENSNNTLTCSFKNEISENKGRLYSKFVVNFTISDGKMKIVESQNEKVVANNKEGIAIMIDRKVMEFIEEKVRLYF